MRLAVAFVLGAAAASWTAWRIAPGVVERVLDRVLPLPDDRATWTPTA